MVTFKDLKIGDSIYEVDIESKKIWIDHTPALVSRKMQKILLAVC